jgi:hypothetical protein
MIKEFIKQQLGMKKPIEYIYKLKVYQNEIDNLIKEFNKEYTYCIGCQDYVKIEESREVVENCRTALRCTKCNSLLRLEG